MRVCGAPLCGARLLCRALLWQYQKEKDIESQKAGVFQQEINTIKMARMAWILISPASSSV